MELKKNTIAEIRAMISNSCLTAGQLYRITDYQCEIRSDWSSFAQSAGNRFDVILLATSESTLNKKGWAIQHEGDTYFANQDLQNWQVWFDVNEGTYGRVLRLIDDKRNDCPYDFKNVKWLDFTIQNGSVVDGTEYLYTFNLKENDVISDFSLNANCFGNSMKEKCYRIIFQSTSSSNNCNTNTFGNNCYYNTFGSYCSRNSFGDDCSFNTFGNYCNYNTFGNNCNTNIFGDNCNRNTFGNNCKSNTFGSACTGNAFGNYCYTNTFGGSCYYNAFGNYCYTNTFGNYCYYNTFGDNCYSNTFGDDCNYNTFGNNCNTNIFGNACTGNAFGNASERKNYYRYNILSNGCSFLYLDTQGTTSGSNFLQNVRVGLGVSGTSAQRKTLTVPVLNASYEQKFEEMGSTVINI